ncbi:MAG: hypothetical protein AB8G22_02240 [Saprospiraceae bacterium]
MLLPTIQPWNINRLLRPFVAIHLFRYISLSLLIPGITKAGAILPQSHIYRLAGGDVASSLLAMCALTALYLKWDKALYVVILLNIVGLLDLLLATVYDMPLLGMELSKLDARMFGLLTTFIPLVFVSHVFMVQTLWKHFRATKSFKI